MSSRGGTRFSSVAWNLSTLATRSDEANDTHRLRGERFPGARGLSKCNKCHPSFHIPYPGSTRSASNIIVFLFLQIHHYIVPATQRACICIQLHPALGVQQPPLELAHDQIKGTAMGTRPPVGEAVEGSTRARQLHPPPGTHSSSMGPTNAASRHTR